MSRSLIRKNQLHPDIADLVGQYGSGFFVSDGQVVYISGNQTISGVKTFATGIFAPNLVYMTGNQTISGVKTFASRPTVNGTGVLLSGEAVAVAQLPNTIVYTTGNQTIGGYKSFTGLANILQVGGYSFLNGTYLGNTSLRAQNIHVGATSSTTINHILGLSTMPGNFQSSEVFANPVSTILNQNNVAFTTGNQTISGVKTFAGSGIFNSGIDLQGSKLLNFTQDIINVNSNFIISGNSNSDFILANSANQITGTIVSGNVNGFNASIIQIGAGNIRITGSGSNVIINSFSNRFRTSGQYAQISILHTGNNGYIMYGNTAV